MAAACARSQTRKKKLECNRPWCRAVHSTLSVPGCCAACGVCACLRCAFAAFFVGANHPTDCRYNTSTVPTGNECVGRTLPASSPESEEIDPKSVHHGTRQTSHTQRHSTHTRDTRAAASSARRPTTGALIHDRVWNPRFVLGTYTVSHTPRRSRHSTVGCGGHMASALHHTVHPGMQLQGPYIVSGLPDMP